MSSGLLIPKRKIAFLLPDFFFIGAQRGAAATIRGLDLKKFEPSVFVVNPSIGMKSEIPDYTQIKALPRTWISAIPVVRIFSWPFQLRKLLDSFPVDVIISISPQTNFILVLYTFLFKKNMYMKKNLKI